MPTLTQTTPAPAQTKSPPLDLEMRLAATDAAMANRLDQSHMRLSINAARPETTVPLDDLNTETLAGHARVLEPYDTPIARLLWRAHQLLTERGWCRQVRDDQGAVCPIHALRVAAGGGGGFEDAATVLLEAIRRRWSDAKSVPSWNARQRDSRQPLAMLQRAADLADARGI